MVFLCAPLRLRAAWPLLALLCLYLSACAGEDDAGDDESLSTEEYTILVRVYDNNGLCDADPALNEVGRCSQLLGGRVHAYSQEDELLASARLDTVTGAAYRDAWHFTLTFEAVRFGTVWVEMDGCDNKNPWGSIGNPATAGDPEAHFKVVESASGGLSCTPQIVVDRSRLDETRPTPRATD